MAKNEEAATEVIVLVVEDEALVRLTIQCALEAAGHAVLAASDGAEACHLLELHHLKLSALVTDIRLGNDTDGWEVASRARALNGNLAVIYVTGDSAHHWPTNGVPQSVLINKPFNEFELVTALSDLLSRSFPKVEVTLRSHPDMPL